MKRFIQTLNKGFSPVLILSYFALCILLLAVMPGSKVGLLVAIACAVVAMIVLRWGLWGILSRAQKHATKEELTVLVRTAEVLMVILTIAALVFTLLLWEIPSLWVMFPVPLFGLQGAVKFDANL